MSKIEIKIFLSSPGDVYVERQIARRILETLKDDVLIRDDISLEIVAWDDPHSGTLMPSTMPPQIAINLKKGRPSECDIVVVVFWGKMGTPLDVETHGTKANGEPYLSGTEWEYLDAKAAHEKNETGLPIIYVYRRTDSPPLPQADDLEKLRDYIVQRERVKTFFEQFTDPVTKAIKGFVHHYETADDFEAQFEIDAKLLIREAQRLHTGKAAKSGPKTQAEPDWHGSPFPGLRPFMPEDAPIYFGRGRETAELVKRLAATPFVAVVGASGSGKSSLVGAGLIPKLNDDAIPGSREWHIVRFTPGENPYLRLAEALIDSLPALQGDPVKYVERCQTLAENLHHSPNALAKTLQHALKDAPDWTKVLLFVDQFEELLTLTPKNQQQPFVEMLTYPAEQVRVVLTMRADFYHRAVDINVLADKLRDGSFPHAAPDRFALLEMIERPAERAGLEFEADLAKHIVQDTGDEPGALALMAYLLDELYQLARKRGDQFLTFVDYEALGRVQGAIGKRAENTFQSLPGTEADKMKLLQEVFRELVEVDERGTATRRRAIFKPEEHSEEARRMIYAFADARLLTTDQSEDFATLEVAHEAVLRSWETLANWIENTQDDLRLLRRTEREALEWEKAGKPDFMRPNAEEIKRFEEACGRLNKPVTDALLRDFLEPEQTRLLREIEDIKTSHQRRSAVSERLNDIGDTRKGVRLRPDGLPDIEWCLVAVPEQTEKGGSNNTVVEIQGQKLEVNLPFYIARYLITYSQFQAFLDAPDGFENDRWWTEMPRKVQKQKMDEMGSKYAIYPCDNVSWYQAMAFTRWLSAKMPLDGLPEESGKDWTIRLPTEWEWQWAAQGGPEAREYTWGGWDEYPRANTRESGLIRPTAVGMYPQGMAACGALDMSGNLWEWCLNKYDEIRITSIDDSNDYHTMRGGSYFLESRYATCACRYGPIPKIRVNRWGLRVCFAPLP